MILSKFTLQLKRSLDVTNNRHDGTLLNKMSSKIFDFNNRMGHDTYDVCLTLRKRFWVRRIVLSTCNRDDIHQTTLFVGEDSGISQ
jgi:hypothetical protein